MNSARGENFSNNNNNNLLNSNSHNIISYQHNNDPVENSRHTAVITKRYNQVNDNYMGINRINTEISDQIHQTQSVYLRKPHWSQHLDQDKTNERAHSQ